MAAAIPRCAREHHNFRFETRFCPAFDNLEARPLTVRVTDASEVYVNGNKVIMADIPARNGTIHGITSVLMP